MSDQSPAVLIPIRATRQSKSRLSSVLDPDQRRELVLALTRDLFDELASCETDIQYGTVTGGGEVAEIVRERGGFVTPEPENADTLGEIVDEAVCSSEQLTDAGGLLVMPVDLPLVDHTALDGLFERLESSDVFLVPDEEEEGTNVLWRNPPRVIPCQYEGTSSFEAHLSVAETHNCSPEIERLDPFRFDLDSPQDWHRLLEDPNRLSDHTREFVTEFMLGVNQTIGG